MTNVLLYHFNHKLRCIIKYGFGGRMIFNIKIKNKKPSINIAKPSFTKTNNTTQHFFLDIFVRKVCTKINVH